MGNLRKRLFPLAAIMSAVLALSACGATSGDSGTTADGKTVVRVGASPVPHARILEYVQQELAPAAGISLEIVEFDDFVQPNEALASGELDANYFQHLPYLEMQIEERGYPFEHGTGVHIEPYAAFSRKYKSFQEVPDGASVAITNDASNQLRGLRVLEQNGQLTGLTKDSTVLNLTAEQNPRGLKFLENQPEVIVQQLDDPAVDVAFVNGNFILTAGLSTADAIGIEAVEGNPYANLLVWRTDNTNEGVTKLEELLHSDQVANFIRRTWPSGDVIAGS